MGTVGREGQFNRAFLPKEESLRDRWEDVRIWRKDLQDFHQWNYIT